MADAQHCRGGGVWGFIFGIPFVKLFGINDRKLSKTMSSYLVNFVRNGNPNGNDLPEWKENLDANTLMQFDEKIGIIDDDLISLYAIMDRLYGFQS